MLHFPSRRGSRRFLPLVLAAAIGAWIVASFGCSDAASPGGVTGASLWYVASGYNGTTWTDQSGSGIVTTQATAPSGFTSPTTIAQDANFYPGVSFNGSTQEVRGVTSTSIFGAANSYLFSVSNFNGTTAGVIGGILGPYFEGSEGIGFFPSGATYYADSSGNVETGPFTVSTTAGTSPYIVTDNYYPNASLLGATTSMNAVTAAATSATNSITASASVEIGGRTAGGQTNRLFAGSIDEALYYNNVTLSANQILQIRSYLALKYGITLGFNTSTVTSTGTNYLSSAGTTIWSGASNATYQYDVAGIGKDATSGLDQRVAHSTNPIPSPNTFDVAIANGTSLSTTSQTANTALSSDQTFVMWGDNAGAASLALHSGVYRMARVWRTQTTGTGSTQLTVRIPVSAMSGVASPTIIVGTDANFQTSPTFTALTCGATYCTVTIPTFTATTQYFTFGAPSPSISTSLVLSPTGLQSPGTHLTYTDTFTNTGGASAATVVIVFPIPTHEDFQIGSNATVLTNTSLTAAVAYSNNSGSTYAYTPVSGAGGAAAGYDRTVTNVRFTLTGTLGFTGPNNTGSCTIGTIIQ